MTKFAVTVLGTSFDKINELGDLGRLREIYDIDRESTPRAYAASRDMLVQALNDTRFTDTVSDIKKAIEALDAAEKESRMVKLSLYRDTADGDIYLLFATENRNIELISRGFEMDVCLAVKVI